MAPSPLRASLTLQGPPHQFGSSFLAWVRSAGPRRALQVWMAWSRTRTRARAGPLQTHTGVKTSSGGLVRRLGRGGGGESPGHADLQGGVGLLVGMVTVEQSHLVLCHGQLPPQGHPEACSTDPGQELFYRDLFSSAHSLEILQIVKSEGRISPYATI